MGHDQVSSGASLAQCDCHLDAHRISHFVAVPGLLAPLVCGSTRASAASFGQFGSLRQTSSSSTVLWLSGRRKSDALVDGLENCCHRDDSTSAHKKKPDQESIGNKLDQESHRQVRIQTLRVIHQGYSWFTERKQIEVALDTVGKRQDAL